MIELKQTETFRKWWTGLKDKRALILARLDRLAYGGLSAWLRRGASKMAEKLTTFDPAEGLTSDDAIAGFMDEAFKTEDVGYIAHALGVVARAKGMTQIANETGLSREQLYRSFSENGNPTLKTTIAVMKALGIALTAAPARDPELSSAA